LLGGHGGRFYETNLVPEDGRGCGGISRARSVCWDYPFSTILLTIRIIPIVVTFLPDALYC
jgi:hypothetical protein